MGNSTFLSDPPQNGKSLTFIRYLILLSCSFFVGILYSQVPEFEYNIVNQLQVNSAISPISPLNSGGVIGNNLPLTTTNYYTTNVFGPTAPTLGYPNKAIGAYCTSAVEDTNGNLFIANGETGKIIKITTEGIVTTFAQFALPTYGSPYGTYSPFLLAIDSSNNIYSVGQNIWTINKITPDGNISQFAALTDVGGGFTDMTIDQEGNVYVAKTNNITKVSPNGVQQIIVNGSSPRGIKYDINSNCLYYLSGNSILKKISLSGTLISSITLSAPCDGFFCIDKNGNIYSTSGNYNAVRINSDGSLLNVFTSSNFANPSIAIGINLKGELYVVDNAILKKLIPRGYSISPSLPDGLNFNRITGVISGTPSVVSPATDYIITGSNFAGSSSKTINIIVKPKTPVVDYKNVCYSSGSTVSEINAKNPVYSLRWYAGQNALTQLQENDVLIPGTYSVCQVVNGVESDRVNIIIGTHPEYIESPAANTTLTTPNTLIIAKSVTGAVKYVFGVTTNGFSKSYESTSRSFRLTDLGTDVSNYLFGTTFNVNVKAYGAGNVMLFPGATCTYTFTTPVAPVLIPSHCGGSISSFSDFITSTDVPGATAYKFRVTGGGLNVEYESAVRQFKLSDIPNIVLLPSTEYNISVAVKFNTIYSSFGTACTITTPSVTTQILPTQCGTTLSALNSYITANNVATASSYKFRVIGGGIDAEYVSTSRQFRLTDIPNVIINYGVAYQVSVAVGQGGQYHTYSPACTVTTPAVYTQVQSSQCNATLTARDSYITANSSNVATSYKFKVQGGGIDAEYVSTSRQFRLTDIPNVIINYGETYQVSVAIGQNGLYHPYGTACSITTPALYTQVQTAQCGAVLAALNSFVTANAVSNATSYKFKVMGGGINAEYISSVRQFKLTDIPNVIINAATGYQVSVAVGQGGLYHPYGPPCTITTPAPLYTQLIPQHCGSQASTIDSYITANDVPAAASYKFKVTANGVHTEFVSATRQFRLTDIPGFTPQYGTAYQISVAVGQGGQYYPYGSTCTITTPYLYTKLVSSHCGSTLSSISSYITADAIATATNYKFKVLGSGVNTEYISPVRQFRLTDIPNVTISFNTAYQVSVAVEINGLYHPYGEVCTITTPQGTQIITAQCGNTQPLLSSYITANAVSNATTYKFRIIGGGIDTVFASPVRQFRLTDIPNVAISFGTTYQISVAVVVNGIEYPYGNSCNITTPSPIYTQVQSSQCGQILQDNTTLIAADPVNVATEYKFKINGGGISTEYISAIPQFRLTDIPNVVIIPGSVYSISVAVKVNAEYHPWGASCTVIAPFVTTQIVADQCGVTLNTIDESIFADTNAFATSYKFTVTGDNFSEDFVTSQPQFKLTDITQAAVAFGQTYQVKVALLIDGMYHPYGSSCNISTPVAIYGQLESSFCNSVLDGWYFNAEWNEHATSYKIKITIDGQEIEYISPYGNTFWLTEIPGIQYGTTYEVQVAIGENGIYHPYGQSCTVTTPLYSSAHIQPSQCGLELNVISDKIYPEEVFLASGYKFKIIGAELNTEYISQNFLNLADVPGVDFGTTYEVSVAAMVNGIYHPYGQECSITTPTPQQMQIGGIICNGTMPSLDYLLSATSSPDLNPGLHHSDPIFGANSYKFMITNSNGLNIEYVSDYDGFRLTDLPISIDYGSTYQIKVAAGFDNAYMPYGPTCNVSTPAAVYTQVSSSQCGGTLTSNIINIDAIEGAIQYKVRIVSGDNTEQILIIGEQPYFAIPNILYGTSYQVSISVLKSGQSGFFPFGTACTITAPSIYCTVVQCDTYLNEINSDISVGPVLGTPLQNITSYKYKIAKGETEVVYISSSNTFKLTDVPGLSVNIGEVFRVSVAVEANGVYHPFSVPCDVMTPAIITTQVQASQCNSTLTNNSTYIYADPVTGAGYRWKVVGGNINTEYVSQGSYIRLTDISPNIGAGVSYQISVAVWKNGQYHPYGNICTVTTPVIYSQITASLCGSTLASNSTPITASSVGATNYIFRVIGPNGTTEYSTPTPSYSLTSTGATIFPGYTYGVQVAVNFGTVFHPFGAVCSVTTPYIITDVAQSHCYGTLAAINSQISANNNFVGATYKFKVVGNGLNAEYETSQNKFRLTDLPGSSIGYNQVYQVSVALKYPGTTYYQPYGSVCNVTTPVALFSKVKASQCNGSVSSASTPVYADYVEQATNYKFKIITGGIEYFYTSQYQVLYLDEVVGLPLNAGSVYTISISLEISGVYHPYGTQCNISLAAPTARVISQDTNCNHVVNDLNDTITFENLEDFTFCKFIIYEDNREFVYNSKEPSLRLSDFKGFNFKNSSTYDLHILVSSDGLEYKETILCNLVTNLNSSAKLDDSLVSSGLSVLVSSNPFSYECDLLIKTAMTSPIEVQVFDSVGKLVDKYIFKESTSFKLGSLWSAGIYNVIVTQGSEIKTVRLVKAGL